MKKFLGALILIFLTTSCANPQARIFNSAKTQAQADVDSAECRRQVGEGGGGFVFGPLFFVIPATVIMAAMGNARVSAYQDCLKSRGYVIQKSSTLATTELYPGSN